MPGRPGKAGRDGKDGQPGKTGPHGQDGYAGHDGQNGVQGPPGPPGSPGQDGVGGTECNCVAVYDSEDEIMENYDTHDNGDMVFSQYSQSSYIKTKMGWAQIKFDNILPLNKDVSINVHAPLSPSL